MGMAVKMLAGYLDSKEMKYQILDDKAIKLGFTADHIKEMDIHLIFNDRDDNVAIRFMNVCYVEPDKKAKIYEVCSKLNSEYRWVKLYVDEESSVLAAGMDSVIQLDTCGEACYEMILRLVNIVDDCYPEIMKVMWG